MVNSTQRLQKIIVCEQKNENALAQNEKITIDIISIKETLDALSIEFELANTMAFEGVIKNSEQLQFVNKMNKVNENIQKLFELIVIFEKC